MISADRQASGNESTATIFGGRIANNMEAEHHVRQHRTKPKIANKE